MTRHLDHLAVLLLCGSMLLIAGCNDNRGRGDGENLHYRGPTQTMSQVVADINANNAQLPTLWARHYYEANIVDEKKQSHFVNGDGALLYRRPQHMLLVGTKPAAGRVFEIGSTSDTYWL